jgi:5-methylcytosine-specific restriction endonuclease McrA
MPDAYHRAEYQRLRLAVLEAAGWQCQWPGCHRRATTVDHVTPLAYGGTNTPGNLRASCWSCNSAGGARVTNELKAARKVGRRSRRW